MRYSLFYRFRDTTPAKRHSVTAEVAGSSLVVPAILFDTLENGSPVAAGLPQKFPNES